MAWKKSPEESLTFLSETLKDVECQSKQMFGYRSTSLTTICLLELIRTTYFYDWRQKIGRRLMNYEGIRPFEPMPGRIMKEYVAIPEPLYRNKKIFTELLAKSIQYVSSLPPKEKKKKTKKK